MSLEKWLEYGWLEREASSRNEIQGLLSIVKRSFSACQGDRHLGESALYCRLQCRSWLRPPQRCGHPAIVLPHSRGITCGPSTLWSTRLRQPQRAPGDSIQSLSAAARIMPSVPVTGMPRRSASARPSLLFEQGVHNEE